MNTYDTSLQTIILVDNQDNEIGQVPKITAHEQGLLHRAFSVILYRYNSKGELEFLLQKRHTAKYHCGGLWTNTCCGHPSPGESIQAAATRRLFEETSIQTVLTQAGAFRYIAKFANTLTEHEFDHVLIAEYQETPQKFNSQEISEVRWVSQKSLEKALNDEPYLYTPWLSQVLNKLKSKLADSQELC